MGFMNVIRLTFGVGGVSAAAVGMSRMMMRRSVVLLKTLSRKKDL